jgi:ABC-2 type transport system permease protein
VIWKKYSAITRTQARTDFTYRGSLSFFAVSAAALIGLQYLLWRGVYHNSAQELGLSFRQVVLYAILARLWIFVLPGFWLGMEFERRIRDGSILRDLMNPVSFIGAWLARSVGRSVGWFLFVALPLLVGGFLWAHPAVTIPDIGLAIVGGICAYIIAFSLCAFVGLSALFLRRADGLNELRDGINTVLGCALIPLAFYPATVASVMKWLPFIGVYYVPLGLLSGMKTVGWLAVVLSAAWAAALAGTLSVCVRVARQRLVLDGG